MDKFDKFDENKEFLFFEEDPKLFKKIILSALLEKLKRTIDKITDEEYLNYRLNNVKSQNIIIWSEIMRKENYTKLNEIYDN